MSPRKRTSKSKDEGKDKIAEKRTSSKSEDKPTKKTASMAGLDMKLMNMPYEDIKSKLVELIKEKSVFEQDMILPSGRITSEHLDLKESILSSEGAFLASMAILYHLHDDVQAIGGSFELAYSIPVSCLQLAYLTGRQLDSFFARGEDGARRFGISKHVEGSLRRGMKVCIVQDVVTDGTAVIDVIRRIQDEAQAEIVQVISLVDREDGADLRFESQGIEYTPIIKMSEVTKIEKPSYSRR